MRAIGSPPYYNHLCPLDVASTLFYYDILTTIIVANALYIAYAMYMKRPQFGFTMPELIIIIVVIGILASILTPMWFGALQSTRDKARETDVRTWAATFENYKGRFGTYPVVPASDAASDNIYACLSPVSSSPTNSRCANFSGSLGQYLESSTGDTASTNWTSIKTAAAKIGTVPPNASPPLGSSYAGPFVKLRTTTVTTATEVDTTVYAEFITFFENNCPSDFTPEILPNSDTTLSAILTNIGSYKMCGLIKSTMNVNPL
jgi:prepilin-type N-terminal cleavage/methylation domain-containing protein